MQSQKITKSTARHLRRKRMNLARKAQKLSESTEGEALANENIQKSIKNTINQQIIESLDFQKDSCSDNLTKLSTLNKNSQKKNSTKNLSNNKEKNNCTRTVSLELDSVNTQLNACEKSSKTEVKLKKTNLKELNTSKESIIQSQDKEISTDMLGTQKLVEENLIMSNNNTQVEVKLQDNAEVGNKQFSQGQKDTSKMDTKPNSVEGKSKAQLRAERRSIQEAQRALKAQNKEKKEMEKKTLNSKVPELKKEPKVASPVIAEKLPTSEQAAKPNEVSIERKVVSKKLQTHTMGMFDHLVDNKFKQVSFLNSSMHPEIVKLGVKYVESKATGSDYRCVELLHALRILIRDFEKTENEDFVRGLEAAINTAMDFLNRCTPISVIMQNALKRLRWQMTMIKEDMEEKQVKSVLTDSIKTYIEEQILLAGEAISRGIQSKISDGEVILTYGYSSLVRKILCDAHNKGKKFRVIVVDSRPRLEGKAMLQKLVSLNISCTYILLSAISFVMPEVTLVLLGAHSILANGYIMARIGTSQVALMSKCYNKDVYAVGEVTRSDDNSYTDSFVYNELGDCDELTTTLDDTKPSPVSNWKSRKTLNLLNLGYDVTPSSLIKYVVTELAVASCSFTATEV